MLSVDPGVEGPVSYRINIFERADRIRTASGKLSGDDALISAACDAERCILTRDDTGETVTVHIVRYSPGSDAQIAVSGLLASF
jgi:hypothetical protein